MVERWNTGCTLTRNKVFRQYLMKISVEQKSADISSYNVVNSSHWSEQTAISRVRRRQESFGPERERAPFSKEINYSRTPTEWSRIRIKITYATFQVDSEANIYIGKQCLEPSIRRLGNSEKPCRQYRKTYITQTCVF